MTDISRAMVEHLCHIHRGYEQHGTVAMLTALRDALDAAEANINIKADWIDATINDMATRDATPVPSDKIAEAARVLLAVDLTPEAENAMADAAYETDDGLWIDGDAGACIRSAALENSFRAALRALAGQGETP